MGEKAMGERRKTGFSGDGPYGGGLILDHRQLKFKEKRRDRNYRIGGSESDQSEQNSRDL